MKTGWLKDIYTRNVTVKGWVCLVLCLCLLDVFQEQRHLLAIISLIITALGLTVMLFWEARYGHRIKDAEKKKRLFELVMDSASDLICCMDKNGHLLYANPPYVQFARKVIPICQDDETPVLFSVNMEDVWKDPSLSCVKESVLLPDGTKKIFDVFRRPVFDDHGRPRLLILTGRETSGIKHGETEVKENIDFYEMVIKIAADFINIPFKDMDEAIDRSLGVVGTWLNVDRAYIFIYDFDKNTVSNTHEWCAKDIDPQIQNLQNLPLDMAPAWVENHIQGELIQIPSVVDLSDSSVKQLLEEQKIQSLIALPLMSNGECLGFVGFDSVRMQKTWSENEVALLKILAEIYANAEYVRRAEVERKSLERQLIQAHKLESVGKLAGGVAHDLNNMLVPILGYSDMILGGIATDDSYRSFVEQIAEAGKRARDIVRQLLTFSCRQTVDMKTVDLNGIIRDFEKLLEHVVGERISLRFVLCPSVPKITGNRGQLEQVIMNLVINARDSISDTGTITVETSVTENGKSYRQHRLGNQDNTGINEEERIGYLPVQPDNLVLLSISDTGCGMDDETMDRIFDPFFTTKDTKGTGFGLATAYGIVKQHGGSISVDSELGKGSTFTLCFPAVDETSSSEDSSADKTPRSLQGNETILLVEDNQQVRNITCTMLQMYDYEVICAENAMDAIKILETSSGQVDLVLTDVVMPGMNGHQLVERILCRFPGIRVLYMSGYSKNIVNDIDILHEGVFFIQKPFTAETLVAKVKEAIKAGR